jgi:AraC-like DNA-binding protein
MSEASGSHHKIPINRMGSLPYSSRRIRLSGEVAYPLHGHDFAEIFWVDEGEMIHHIHGEDILLREGDCVFVRPWDVHSLHSVCGDDPFWIVNTIFPWHVYEALKMRYFQGNHCPYGEDEPKARTIRLGERQLQRMRQELVFLLRASRHLFYIERFLMNLLGECCDLAVESSLIPKESPQWLQNAWHTFQNPEYFREGASAFYRLCGRSAEHASREFRRCTGKTVQECAHELRIRHAGALLAGTTKEIADIALECGFESLSHFYASFKAVEGMTPRSYRIQSQKRMYIS